MLISNVNQALFLFHKIFPGAEIGITPYRHGNVELGAWLNAFFTLALEGDEQLASRRGRLTREKRTPVSTG
jgi:hypothetical protein